MSLFVITLAPCPPPPSTGLFPRPSYSFSNVQQDVLLNPYAPPLRDERVIQSTDIRGGIPINIDTRAVDTNYRQMGLLKRMILRNSKIFYLIFIRGPANWIFSRRTIVRTRPRRSSVATG